MARLALLIANGHFEDPKIPALQSPAGDCQRLKAVLESEDIGGYRVRLVTDGKSASVRREIQLLMDRAEPDDLVLVFISGHGFKDTSGRLYFASADTDLTCLSATAIASNFLIERMQECIAAKQVLILDTCFAGAFARGLTFKSAGSGVSQDDFQGSGPNYEDEASGRAVITASAAVQPATEKAAGAVVQSLFTRLFIESLRSGTADADGSGLVTLDGLYADVRRRMRLETGSQSPQRWLFGMDGSVVIARNPFGQALPRDLSEAAKSGSRLVRIAVSDELLAFCRSNKGKARDEAMAALEDLRKDRDPLVSAAAELALEEVAHSPFGQAPDVSLRPSGFEAPAQLPLVPGYQGVTIDLTGRNFTERSSYKSLAKDPPGKARPADTATPAPEAPVALNSLDRYLGIAVDLTGGNFRDRSSYKSLGKNR